MKELVLTLAKALVDNPDAVQVDEVESGRGVTIQLVVAREDLGKIIGKDGRTAQAIRSVMHAACSKNGRRVQLDIVD